MKLRNLFLGAAAAVAMFAACAPETENLGTPSITISESTMEFEVAGGEHHGQEEHGAVEGPARELAVEQQRHDQREHDDQRHDQFKRRLKKLKKRPEHALYFIISQMLE